MKEKIYETILNKPVRIERLKKNAEKKLKDGYFHKWGEFKYRWKGGSILYIGSKNWTGKITFLKNKLKIDLDLPIVHKIPGEIVFSKNKKLSYFADMPFLVKPLAMPIIKQIADEIKKLT